MFLCPNIQTCVGSTITSKSSTLQNYEKEIHLFRFPILLDIALHLDIFILRKIDKHAKYLPSEDS